MSSIDTLSVPAEDADESLVRLFLKQYRMVNGCLRWRSGPDRNACRCGSRDAILYAEIAARHQLWEFETFMRLFAQMGNASQAAWEQGQYKALWMWLRPYWLDPLLDGKIGDTRHRDRDAL